MSRSLKGALTVLARLMPGTPDSLYERQRNLARDGLLEHEPGRGPGSGARLTPKGVALLMISSMASLNLSESARLTRIVAGAKARDKRCPLTGKSTFVDALAELLSNKNLLDRTRVISVSGTQGRGAIEFVTKNKISKSEFAGPETPGIPMTISWSVHEVPEYTERMLELWEVA
jgi:hypothetical protein